MPVRAWSRMPRAVIMGLAAVVALHAAMARARAASESEGDPVIVEVNGTPIHRSSVRELVKSVLAASAEIPDSEEIDALSRDALDSLIDLELLYQEARARGMRVTDEAVDEQISLTRESFPDEDDFAEALHRSGLTEPQLRDETRKTMLVNHLLETVVWRDIRITDAKIKAFYEKNRGALAKSDRVRVRHILVRVPPGTPPAGREQALLRAKEIRRRLVEGADFAQLAREESEDERTRARGGDLGYLDSDAGGPLARAARSLEPGEISPIVESAEGYHVIQVTQRGETRARELDGPMRAAITKVLLEEEKRRRQAEFVAALRKKAEIRFVEPKSEGPAAVPTPAAVPSPPAEGTSG